MNQSAALSSRPFLSSRDIAFMALGAALLAASSHIEVPFYPVPMTMQTMVVLGLGLAGGWKRGIGAVLTFLAIGAMGAPVFANGGAGPLVFMGPTGGYLLGFIFAAGLCGLARDKGLTQTIPGSLLTALIGTSLIYIPGLLQLGTLLGWDKPILDYGFYPFILGDITKALIAALGLQAFTRTFSKG